MQQKIGIELCIAAAEQHGKNESTHHQVEDLQDSLRKMWEILKPAQRLQFMANEEVKGQIESNLPNVDTKEAFNLLVAAQRVEITDKRAVLQRGVDLLSRLVSENPSLLDGTPFSVSDFTERLHKDLDRMQTLRLSQIAQSEDDDAPSSHAPSM